jgi:hypothetical protein
MALLLGYLREQAFCGIFEGHPSNSCRNTGSDSGTIGEVDTRTQEQQGTDTKLWGQEKVMAS